MNTPSIRASDTERDQVTGTLQRAVAEGRLTPEEGGERLAAASAARYRDELGRLVRDLPVVEPSSSGRGTMWPVLAARLVRGLVFGAALATLAVLGVGFFLPFWIAGCAALAFAMGGRRRWHRASRRRWGWHGGPWSSERSSRAVG